MTATPYFTGDASPYGGGDPYADHRTAGFPFTHLVDLADRRPGGGDIAAGDGFFTERENLLKPEPAEFDPERFGHKGKIMDGRETRRRRDKGNDWIRYRLAEQAEIRAAEIDTAYLKGDAVISVGDGGEGERREILPRTRLQPDTDRRSVLPEPVRGTHVRTDVLPDGGTSRLRLSGSLTGEARHGRPPATRSSADSLRTHRARPAGGCAGSRPACMDMGPWSGRRRPDQESP